MTNDSASVRADENGFFLLLSGLLRLLHEKSRASLRKRSEVLLAIFFFDIYLFLVLVI